MDGYDKLNFIDKIRFRWRVRQQEKLEDKRQNLEGDDRIPVDKQSIINELLAERANKKNKVKALSSAENQTIKENKLEQYKVPNETLKTPLEMHIEHEQKKLDQMLGKKLKSEIDAYEYIIELQTFLSYPHDNLPNLENKVNEKLFYIQNTLGKDIFNKGIQIYEVDKSLKEMYSTISIEDRVKLEQEILNNPNLSEQLTYLRYNPEDSKKQTGEIVNYQAVYSKMMEKMRENEYNGRNENSSDLDEK